MDIDSFEFGTGAIYRIQSNGTNKETVHEGLYSVYGIAIDENHDTLYWADPADYKIYNSTLSGENISSIPGGYPPYYLTLDAANSILYWTGISSPSIISLDISNGDHSTLLTNNYPEGIVFDPTSQYIYYTDNHTPTTWRIRPDGTDNAQILALNSSYTNISIDSASRHLYWMCNNSIKRLSIEDSVYEELREFTGKQIALRTLDPSITIIGSRYAALGTHVILRVGGLPALVGNVTYEWYRNNALIPSTATNTYEIASAGYEHSGTYHVMVTDESKGIFMSSPFELIVTDSPLPAANLMLLGMLVIVLTGLGASSICKQD